MKTEMSEDGVITIRPESSVEAYALRQWVNDYPAHDAECSLTQPSYLVVDARWPQEKTS